MAEKDKGSLDFSRRDFFRLASTGAMMFAASALPGGTALAATTERSKPAHGSRARNTLKAAGNKGKADLLILGNVITMDEYKPFAQAVAVRGDTILYVGDAEVARKLCDSRTTIFDYRKNSVYPGFLEAHCHPGAGRYNMIGKAMLDQFDTLDNWLRVIKKYVADNPQKNLISAEGFSTSGAEPNAAMLDAISSDKSIVVESSDKHTMWLNSKAMEEFGINRDAVKKWGTDCVHVDANGNPTGIISENPTFQVRAKINIPVDEMKKALLAWQDYALSNGYTGTYNAGVELLSSGKLRAGKRRQAQALQLFRQLYRRQYTHSGRGQGGRRSRKAQQQAL